MTEGHLVQEYRFRSKGGHYLWMQDEASLLRDADGRPKEIIGFWTNITELMQAEEQAAHARALEVEIGFKIQQTLLLDQPPRDFPGARVAALTIPSQRISGDFYDFFRHVDQCLDVVIGDVMGKGIPAALLGAACKSTFLQAFSEGWAMDITIGQIGGVAVVLLPGKDLDAANTAEFKSTIAPVLKAHTKVVFDLSQLRFIDSSGLGAFLSCLRQLSTKGGELKLCGMSTQVYQTFQLVRMHRIFDIYSTKNEAVAAFQP